MDPIRIWEYYQSPEELRCSNNGGDEDFLILIPPGQEVPWQLTQLGCCCNDHFFVRHDGEIVFLRPSEKADAKAIEEPTGLLALSYRGCHIIIASHS